MNKTQKVGFLSGLFLFSASFHKILTHRDHVFGLVGYCKDPPDSMPRARPTFLVHIIDVDLIVEKCIEKPDQEMFVFRISEYPLESVVGADIYKGRKVVAARSHGSCFYLFLC